MNWADYGILAIIVLSALIGLLRGFTRELFGLGTWILAILLCVLLGPDLAQALQPHFATPLLRAGVAYGGLFLGGLLIGGILTAILVERIRDSRFASTDRTLGIGLGLIRGLLLVGLLVLLARTTGMNEKPWWKQSPLIEPAQVLADGLDVIIPDAWLAPLKPDPAPTPDAAPLPTPDGTAPAKPAPGA